MISRLSIFAKIFIAFSGLALIPLVIVMALLTSNYEQMTQQLIDQADANVSAEMAVHISQRVAQVTHDAYLMLAFVFLISTILVLFTAVFLSQSFSKPVRLLSAATQHLARGDFSMRLETDRQDEFGALVESFNRMADQLEDAHRRLETANADLEGRVLLRTAELEMVNLQLRAAADKMEETVRLKGDFLANLSHELLTPLQAVLGYAELLFDRIYGPLDDRQHEAVGRIRHNAQMLQRLISDIIDLAKVETGRMTLTIEQFSPCELVESIVQTLRPLFLTKRLELKCECAADLPVTLSSDRGKVQHVLYNLLSNSLKFTNAGEVSLRVAGRDDGRRVTIEVRDTGIGIAPDKLATIFESYRQVDSSSTRPAGGAGIGLALTKQLVDLLGGDIEVESELEKGSLFRVVIPAKISFNRDPEARTTAIGAKTIVSIDDDETMLDLLTETLEPAGFRVIRCTDGDAGVALAKQIHPYAVTLDIRLPERDGWSILQELKNNPETRGIPVIILSVIEDRAQGDQFGVDGYLTKPFSRDELIEHLRSVRRESVKYH